MTQISNSEFTWKTKLFIFVGILFAAILIEFAITTMFDNTPTGYKNQNPPGDTQTVVVPQATNATISNDTVR
ncbi:hypothetical protein [Microcystis phage Mel-JY01]